MRAARLEKERYEHQVQSSMLRSKLLDGTSLHTANTTYQDGFSSHKLEPVPKPKKTKKRRISPTMKKKANIFDDIIGEFYDEDDLPASEKQRRE